MHLYMFSRPALPLALSIRRGLLHNYLVTILVVRSISHISSGWISQFAIHWLVLCVRAWIAARS